MNKTSTRTIELFISGAFALIGFRALVWLPYYLATSQDSAHIVSSIVSGLALLIGIGIFQGRASATLWAKIYLWIVVILGWVTIPLIWRFSPDRAGRITLMVAPELLVAVVLLGLLYWSRSLRFAEPQGGANGSRPIRSDTNSTSSAAGSRRLS